MFPTFRQQPGVVRVVRVDEILATHPPQFLLRAPEHAAGRRVGGENTAARHGEQDRVQAVFKQGPVAQFARPERLLRLTPLDHLAEQARRHLQPPFGQLDDERRPRLVGLGPQAHFVLVHLETGREFPAPGRFTRRIAVAEGHGADDRPAGAHRYRAGAQPARAGVVHALAAVDDLPGGVGPAGFVTEPAAAAQGLAVVVTRAEAARGRVEQPAPPGGDQVQGVVPVFLVDRRRGLEQIEKVADDVGEHGRAHRGADQPVRVQLGQVAVRLRLDGPAHGPPRVELPLDATQGRRALYGLHRMPHRLHEQAQGEGVGVVVVHGLVGHADHGLHPALVDDRHGEEPLEVHVALGVAPFERVVGLEIVDQDRPPLTDRLAPEAGPVELVKGGRVVHRALRQDAPGPAVGPELLLLVVVQVDVADGAGGQLDGLVHGLFEELRQRPRALLKQVHRGLEPLGVTPALRLGLPPGDDLVLQLEHLLFELAHQPVVVEEQHLLLRRLGRGRRMRLPGSRGHLANHRQQSLRFGRFHEKAVGAAASGQVLVLGVGVGAGVDEHGQVAQAGIGADLAAELEAVHHRHEDVADHQVKRFGAEHGQGLAAVCGGAHAVAVPLEENLQQVAALVIVIHGENTHASSCSSDHLSR